MTKGLMRFAALGLASLAFAIPALAQNKPAHADRYVVSAKAGGVNVVEGTVGVVRKNGQSGRLVKGDNLVVGDRVSTGADGKVEILLNPGSFVRVGGNSAFEFRSTKLENLELMLHRGSAIFEVFASEEYTVDLLGPKSKFVVVDSGVYRMDVTDSDSVLSVWKGKARVGSETGELLKGGRESKTVGGSIVAAKFDRDEKDELDRWSKARSKELSKMIASLDRDTVRNSLMRSYAGRQWNMFSSFGLWVYDPFRLSYCFLPFGYGWSSPYGYGYGRWLNWYDFPTIYYPWNPNGYPPATPGGGTPTNPPAQTPTNPNATRAETRQRGARVPSPGMPIAEPPFQRMQKQEGGSFPRRDTSDSSGSSDRGGGIWVPSAPSSPTKTESNPNSTTKQP